MIRGQEMLGPRLYPFDWTPGFHREQTRQDHVGIADDLRAEPPANVSRNHPDSIGWKSERKGNPRDAEHGHLIVEVHREESGRLVEVRKDRVVLYGGRTEPVEMELLLQHLVGFLHRGVHVSVIPFFMEDQV